MLTNISDKEYCISEVCELLKIEPYTLRYMEKKINLNIKRDPQLNRIYSCNDIDIIQQIKSYRDQGIDYRDIKSIMFPLKAELPEVLEDNDLMLLNLFPKEIVTREPEVAAKIVDFLNALLSKSIEKSIATSFNLILEKINNLESNNEKLKQALEKQQKEHFDIIDSKLTSWREEQESKKNKSIFKKLFK